MKTRIKICGLTREEDVDAAVAAGADAIGFVFHPPSPRFVTPQRAAELARRVPPFVAVVGLFVNATPETVLAACHALPIGILQFHGDEEAAYCRQFARPYLRAARVRPGLDLLEFAGAFPDARGLLLDAFVAGYGGGGDEGGEAAFLHEEVSVLCLFFRPEGVPEDGKEDRFYKPGRPTASTRSRNPTRRPM